MFCRSENIVQNLKKYLDCWVPSKTLKGRFFGGTHEEKEEASLAERHAQAYTDDKEGQIRQSPDRPSLTDRVRHGNGNDGDSVREEGGDKRAVQSNKRNGATAPDYHRYCQGCGQRIVFDWCVEREVDGVTYTVHDERCLRKVRWRQLTG